MKTFILKPGSIINNNEALRSVLEQIELTKTSIDLWVYVLTHKELIQRLKNKLKNITQFRMRIIVDSYSIGEDEKEGSFKWLQELVNLGAWVKVYNSNKTGMIF